MELENQEIPYGYTINDIDIVVDPLPAENVKFLFQKLEEYDKNPPKELVQNILEERKELTYEEAKSLVNFRDIVRYISKEVKIKNMVFTLSDAPATVETLRSILARPLDTFSNEELGKTCVEKMENRDKEWKRRVRLISPTKKEMRSRQGIKENQKGAKALVSQNVFDKAMQIVEEKSHQELL